MKFIEQVVKKNMRELVMRLLSRIKLKLLNVTGLVERCPDEIYLKIMVTTKKGKLRKAKIRKAMKYFLGRFRELAVLNYPVNQGNLRQMI